MKHVTKKLFSIALLASTMVHAADDVSGLSFFMGQRNSAFTSNGLIQQANHCEKESDTLTAHVSAGYEFSKSMDNEKIANYFSLNGTNKMAFGTEAATATDIFSVNFFLPQDHVSTVTFNPDFRSHNVDFRLHVGLDEFVEHLWFNADLPIVHAKWDLGLTKSVTTAGTTLEATAGIWAIGANAATYPYTDPILALEGNATAFTGAPDVTAPLSYGKFSSANSKNHTKTKLGNARLVLGYDFISKDNAQLGLGFLGLINGDDVSDAKYINTPTIGTGGRHGVGGRLDGSVRLWESNDWEVAAHLRADYAYILETTVRRSFDFDNNGVWSRYLLLVKRTAFDAITGITNAVNVTSLQAKVGKFHMYDVNLMFSAVGNAWEINAGYNLAGMSKENLSSFVDTIPASTYTFFGYTNAPVAAAKNTSLNAANVQIDGSAGTKGTEAPNVAIADAAALATAAVTNTSLDQASGLQPQTMSHRVYGNVGYTFDSNEWMPRVSVGGSAEFASNNRAVRQWGFHFTGGICF